MDQERSSTSGTTNGLEETEKTNTFRKRQLNLAVILPRILATREQIAYLDHISVCFSQEDFAQGVEIASICTGYPARLTYTVEIWTASAETNIVIIEMIWVEWVRLCDKIAHCTLVS